MKISRISNAQNKRNNDIQNHCFFIPDTLLIVSSSIQHVLHVACCMLRSSGISPKSGTLIVRYSQKKEYISFVFYCSENLSIAITLEPVVRFRWSFQQNVPLLMRTSINRKLKMSHVRLPTDSPRLHHIC